MARPRRSIGSRALEAIVCVRPPCPSVSAEAAIGQRCGKPVSVRWASPSNAMRSARYTPSSGWCCMRVFCECTRGAQAALGSVDGQGPLFGVWTAGAPGKSSCRSRHSLCHSATLPSAHSRTVTNAEEGGTFRWAFRLLIPRSGRRVHFAPRSRR